MFAAAGWEVSAPARAELDVADRAAVHDAIEGLRPDAVVNGAAFTAVDACETEVDRAYRVNALGVRHLAEASRRVGAHLCHISTDYVFDGTKVGPYVEWDRDQPAVGLRPVQARAARSRPGPRRPSCARRGCAASTAPT